MLAAGDWRAELRPECGGAIGTLTFAGVEVLRTMPAGSADPLTAACFPLVPWCNRVRHARFAWNGREVRLPANFAPEPHSLHGLGWRTPWTVTQEGAGEARMVHRHDGGEGWPWVYEAEQWLRLGSQGCALTLAVTNRGDTAMPCGLGLHPYFRRRAETRLRFAARTMLEVDDELIPTGAAAAADRSADWAGGAALPLETVDHCFTGWDGMATIEDDLGAIRLAAGGAPFLHVYAPADGSALCLEPVNHAPDALNRAPGKMALLAPGCSAGVTLQILV